MSKLIPPKRYNVQLTHSGMITIEADNGQWIQSHQAIAYANDLARQARFEALDEVIQRIQSYPVGGYVSTNGEVAQMETVENIIASIDLLKKMGQ